MESIHTSNQGKNFADLQITIDVLTAMHLNDNIDEFMIMSNDKDMTPLLNNIRYNKRKVSVVTVGTKYNEAICSFSDEQIKYEDIIQENVLESYIHVLEERIEKNLVNTFNKYKSKCSSDSTAHFQHIGFEYFCEMQMKNCHLMIYEVYNCIKNLNDRGGLVFYKYKFKSHPYIGIAPYAEKAYLTGALGIAESDFTVPDIDKKIIDLYKKYRKEK